jgi:hypothetical protein
MEKGLKMRFQRVKMSKGKGFSSKMIKKYLININIIEPVCKKGLKWGVKNAYHSPLFFCSIAKQMLIKHEKKSI